VAGYTPTSPIDAALLARLRELGELSGDCPPGVGITIDFGAARDLGQPLVIVRVPPSASLPGTLTAREREVAALVARGMRNREIAEQLCLLVATVKDHVHAILEKIGLRSRAAVVAAFTGAGYGVPNTPAIHRRMGFPDGAPWPERGT
jgi:DNA-binding NarL/FixJ family response regulator